MGKYCAVLDAGHGRWTAGKRTPHIPSINRAIHEWEFNIEVVRRVERYFSNHASVKVITTADGNLDVSRPQRVAIANSQLNKYARDDIIFISVHYNAMTDKMDASNACGLEVYHYPNSAPSIKLAGLVYNHTRAVHPWQKPRGIKPARFDVIANTLMPAALVEFGFMDDPYESALMLNPTYLDECAYAVVLAIYDYFNLEAKRPEFWECVLAFVLDRPDAWKKEATKAKGITKYLPDFIKKLRGASYV